MKWLEYILEEIIKQVFDAVNDDLERDHQLRKIPILRQNYINSLFERTRYIQLPFMSGPRSMIDLFVELYAFKIPKRWKIGLPEDTEQEIINTSDVLSKSKHVCILGEPGAGKTTFLRRVAYSICNQHDTYVFFGKPLNSFPVLIECRSTLLAQSFQEHRRRVNAANEIARQLKKKKKSDEYISKHVYYPPPPLILALGDELRRFDIPYADEFVKQLLKSGKIVLFIDGLDEARLNHRKLIVSELNAIRERYPETHIVLTCRSAEADLLPNGFSMHEIMPLSEIQRERFVRLWFAGQARKAEEFLFHVQNTHIWGISDRPLLLTLLCSLYESGGELPKYKVDLYRECVELALRRWDAFRDIKRESAFGSLSLNQRINILGRIAAEMTLAGISELTRENLDCKINLSMEENGIEGRAQRLRDEIISHSGLMQQISINSYSFSHKSLQEYFSALWFSINDPLLPVKKVQRDKQWRGTLEMTACMVPDASKILWQLTDPIKRLFNVYTKVVEEAINFVASNPLTIPSKGREKLVLRAMNTMQHLVRNIEYLVPVDVSKFSSLNVESFPDHYVYNNKWGDYCVYTIHNTQYDNTLQTDKRLYISLLSVFLLLLLSPAPTLTLQLVRKHHASWFHSILMTALIHNDPKICSSKDDGLISDIGRQISASLSRKYF